MSAIKKFHWLKQPSTFFQDPKIKKLRRIAGGDTYTIIYQKIMLLSIVSGGVISYDGIEDSFSKELALILDEDADNVSVTLSFMQTQGLIEEINEDSFLIVSVPALIGAESDSAERMRRLRNKKANQKAIAIETDSDKKASQCDGHVTDSDEQEKVSDTELEKEKELELERKKSKKEFSPLDALPTWLNLEAWEKWIQHRKEIKKPLTPTSTKQQLEFLEEHKSDHVEIIKASINGGYMGLFPINGDGKSALRDRCLNETRRDYTVDPNRPF